MALTNPNVNIWSITSEGSSLELIAVDKGRGTLESISITNQHRSTETVISLFLDDGIEFTDATCDYNNDPTITHDANSSIVVGLNVTGTGIPKGATIASITDPTHFELSENTTGGSLTDQSLTFSSPIFLAGPISIPGGVTLQLDNVSFNNSIYALKITTLAGGYPLSIIAR